MEREAKLIPFSLNTYKKDTIMKKYIAPEFEICEVVAEQGYQLSEGLTIPGLPAEDDTIEW